MANPYDQFVKDEEQQVPQMPVVQPGQMPDVAGIPQPAAPTDNPYEQPDVLMNPPEITREKYEADLYRRIRRGDSAAEIMEWSNSMGQTLDEESLTQNIAIREQAKADGRENYALGEVLAPDRWSPAGTLEDLGTILRTGANVPLFNFGDEAFAAVRAGLQEGDFMDNYEKNWTQYDTQDQLDARYRQGARNVGLGLGVAGSMFMPGAVFDKAVRYAAPRVATTAGNAAVQGGASARNVARAVKAGDVGARVAVGAGTGAATGALAATGEGSVDDRFEYTGGGAAIGAIAGAGFPLVAEAFSRLSRPIRERLFPNSDKAAARRFKFTEDELAAMEAELKRQRGLGMEPALMDIMPERARSVLGGMGSYDSAREVLQDTAASRTEQLGERMSNRFEENIGPTSNPRTTSAAMGEYRDAQMDEAMERLRDVRVPANNELLEVLSTQQGRSAIQRAINAEPNWERRTVMAGVLENLNRLGDIPADLSESARGQIISQLLGDEGVTVGFLERIRKELRRAAKEGDTDYAAVNALAQTVERAARRNKDYDQALTDYASRSRAMEASDVGTGGTRDREEVGGFLNEDVDDFGRQVSGLRREYPTREVRPDDETMARIENIENQVDEMFVGDTRPQATALFEQEVRTRARRAGIHEDDIRAYQRLNSADRSPRTESQVRMQSRRPTSGSMEQTPRNTRPVDAQGRDREVAALANQRQRTNINTTAFSRMDEEEFISNYERLQDNESIMGREKLLVMDEEVTRRIDKLRNEGREEEAQAFTNRVNKINRDTNRRRNEAREAARAARQNRSYEEELLDANNGASPDHVVRRFRDAPGEAQTKYVQYTLEDGGTLTADLSIKPSSDVAMITVNGIGAHADIAGTYGPGVMRQVASLIREQFPQIRYIAGHRVTGARAKPSAKPRNEYQVVPAGDINTVKDAPTEIELARQGASRVASVRANESPQAAQALGERMVRGNNQRARTDILIGAEAGNRLRAQLDEELQRVYRARRQRSGERPRGEGRLEAAENAANAMYNPASPIPWIREGMRFLHRLGIREKDARNIVEAAVDPERTDELIEVLTQRGVARERAALWVDEARDAIIKGLTVQEG